MSCKDDHTPATCKVRQVVALATAQCAQMRNEWFKTLKADDANLVWILKSTKARWRNSNACVTQPQPCPKCAMPIEKNGGCNWLCCGKCRFEFCWMCGQNIKHSDIDAAGGSHKCNVFDESADKARSKQQTDATRYLFYYQRYSAHRDSAKLEKLLFNKLRDKMETDPTLAGSMIELLVCRHSTCVHL